MKTPVTIAGVLRIPRSEAGLATRLRASVGPMARQLGIPATELVRSTPEGWEAPRAVALPPGVRPKDATALPPLAALAWRSGHTLRPFQAAAVGAWLRSKSGVIVAPCGGGKTELGVAAVQRCGTRALVLVHTRDLVTQWQERVQARLVGVRVDTTPDLARAPKAHVVVATVQQLAAANRRDLERWAQGFGLLILDEAHHAPAATFQSVVTAIPARYRLGLTATPDRLDGKRQLLHAHFGPVAHEITTAQLERIGATLAPEIRYLPTGWSPRGGERADVALSHAEGRNRAIVGAVRGYLGDHRRVLVLVSRVAHAEELQRLLGARAAVLVGSMPSAERAKRLLELRTGKLGCIVATSLADEGLDLPEVDTVVLAAPTESLGRVQQRIGRALRPQRGKRAVVLDVLDAHASAREAARARDALYERLGWRTECADANGRRARGRAA